MTIKILYKLAPIRFVDVNSVRFEVQTFISEQLALIYTFENIRKILVT